MLRLRQHRRCRALLLWYALFAAVVLLLWLPCCGQAEAEADPPSPVHPVEGRYLSFAPWNGGWNNRRMSLELAVALAMISNRTLVLPPRSVVPLADGESAYEDFLNISRLHGALPAGVLRWPEFDAVLRGLPKQRGHMMPCSAQYRLPKPRLFCEKAWALRQRATLVKWKALDTVLPAPTGSRLSPAEAAVLKVFAGARTSRLEEWEALQGSAVLHFPQNLFGHFYQMVFPRDDRTRRALLRGVRDGIVFNDTLQQAALTAASELPPLFSCMHIRRRDFKRQYRMTYLPPTTIARNVGLHLSHDVYVASDEEDPAFWEGMRDAFPEHRLHRHLPSMRGLSVNDAGFVEQLLCAKADVFVGTRYSTFSAYITRLRGYSRAVQNKEVWQQAVTPPRVSLAAKLTAQVYLTDVEYDKRRPRLRPDVPYSWRKWTRTSWSREFPEAWTDID